MAWKFDDYKQNLLKEYFTLFPSFAAYLGIEDSYTKKDELSQEKIIEIDRWTKCFIKELDNNFYALENIMEQYEAELILWNLNHLRYIFFIDKEFEYNPFFYFSFLDYSVFLKLNGKDPDFISECVVIKLSNYGNILSFMKNSIIHASSQSLSVFQESLEGIQRSIKTDLSILYNKCMDINPSAAYELKKAVEEGETVLKDMVDFIKELQQNNKNPFSIGHERLTEMIYYNELKKESLAGLLQTAEKEVAFLKERLMGLKPGLSFYSIYDSYLGDYPEEGSVIQNIKNILAELRDFIAQKDIIEIYDLETLKVEKMPPYFEWASAMMSTPGPFVKGQSDSFYYITLPKADWTYEQKQDFLRSFNTYLLENLSVHEALPGHFVHSTYEKRIESDIIKISYGYGFSEGWAHYCEEMMLKEGFRHGDPGGEIAKIREQMLRLIRMISSIRLHTGTMELEESKALFLELCYLDNETARQEALRATYDPCYLLYTYGKWKILQLRGKNQKVKLKHFHNNLLALGCPPIGLMEKYYGMIKY